MKTRTKIILTAVITAVLTASATLCAVALIFGITPAGMSGQLPLLSKISNMYSLVNGNYFYTTDENTADSAARSFVASLGDPYAAYFSASEYGARNNMLHGKKIGIGVTIAKHPDSGKMIVVYVNRDCPSRTAGIKVGDAILSINGTAITGTEINDAAQLIQGKEGEKVTLSIQRGKKSLEINVIRKNFVSDSVMWRNLGGTGCIKIETFNETTYEQFMQGYKELEKAKVSSLVFDLRNNTGGTTDDCLKILDFLLPEGELMRVRYHDGETKVLKTSDKTETKLPMAVLQNERTASCAEIFAMNIRDFKKGKTVGVKSFGKGIMQTTYRIFDGSAIKFTTAQVLEKNGETYHEKGLEPDIEVKLNDYQQKYFAFINDKDDPQLQKALSLLK